MPQRGYLSVENISIYMFYVPRRGYLAELQMLLNESALNPLRASPGSPYGAHHFNGSGTATDR